MQTLAESTGPAELLLAFRRAVDAKIARDLAEEDRRALELREAVIPLVRIGLGQARAEGLCREAWLYGSYAWGKPTGRSDVDLIVAGADDSFLVAAIVANACGREAHVVRLDRAPESLRTRALAEGVAL